MHQTEHTHEFGELNPRNPQLGDPDAIAKLSDWELLEHVLSIDVEATRIVFVWGPPGIGKTYAAYRYGNLERGFAAVTLTEDTSAAELRGHFVFKGGDTVWHDGPFVRAMRQGMRLVLNEISRANADVMALLYPVLESVETAELTLPTGETIRPAPGFTVVATDNLGPDQLPEALDDRFGVYLRLEEPHPAALASLHPELRQPAADSAKLDGERRLSARGMKSLQSLIPVYGLAAACKLAFGKERGPLVHDTLLMAPHRKPRSKSRRP